MYDIRNVTAYTTFKIINKIFLNACMCAAGRGELGTT